MTRISSTVTASTVSEVQDLVRAELDRRLPGAGSPQRYAVLPAGKLLRPVLVLLAAQAVGGDLDRVLPAAVGVEYLHAGSLVHDDIIDGDSERRGHASLHTHYGRDLAIVTGDALMFDWFAQLAECERRGADPVQVVAALRIQAQTGILVCEGAARELAMAGRTDVAVPEYLEMIRLKTAVLIAAACRVGALLSGGSPARVQALADYGEALGTAFQIEDDLLPYHHASAGKPAGSDLANQRPTLPLLLGLRRADPVTRREIERLLDHGRHDPESALSRMRSVLEECGALEAARLLANSYHEAARQALRALNPGTAVSELAVIAQPSPMNLRTRS